MISNKLKIRSIGLIPVRLNSSRLFRKALLELKETDMEGLVIDLRSN